jgi:calcineurin-like phosphoesterase family protein
MYFFIADEHYDHPNMLIYHPGPFSNIGQKNELMISNNNAVVGPGDTVVHAGDFYWGKDYKDAQKFISGLNGNHVFIEGDHDKWLRGVSRRRQIWKKKIDDHYIFVCHYAMHTWARSHYNSWCLYGHSHKDLGLPGKRHCISVENTNYFPVSLEEIRAIMESKGDNPNYIPPEKRHRQRGG